MGLLLVMDLDGEVRAEQLALHALDTIFRPWNRDQEDVHLQDILRAEFDADAAALAVALDDFDSCTTHSGLSPLSLVAAETSGFCGEKIAQVAILRHNKFCILYIFTESLMRLKKTLVFYVKLQVGYERRAMSPLPFFRVRHEKFKA